MNLTLGILAFSVLMNVVATYAGYRCIRSKLQLLQDDVSQIRMRSVPVNVGGRLAPTGLELEQARNRMDRLGIAHPGGSG